jgi:type IV secretion system protein TrbL
MFSCPSGEMNPSWINFDIFRGKMKKRCFKISLFIVLILLATAPDVLAANSPDNQINLILQAFKNTTSQWVGPVKTATLRLFWLLAFIEFTWMSIILALKQADIIEWAADIVRRIMIIGLFLAFITQAQNWSKAIINSILMLANQANAAAGVLSIAPDTVFERGMELVLKVLSGGSFWEPVDSLGFLVAGIILAVLFAGMAAMLLVGYIELFIIVNAGFIVLALGAMGWTRQIATNYWIALIKGALKLFALMIVMGLCMSFVTAWVDQFQNDSDTSIILMIGVAFVMFILVQSIPSIIESVMSGTLTQGPNAGAVAGAAVGGAMGAATSAAVSGSGGLMALREAAKLAGEQTNNGGGSLVGQTMKNMASAAKSDLEGRLSGQAHFGTMGGRMAANMREQRLGSASTPDSLGKQPKPEKEGSNTVGPRSHYISPLNSDSKDQQS